MVKKGYLVVIIMLIVVLVVIVIIVKKPKTVQEYFETGVNLHKNVDISAEEHRKMSPEEEEEYRKMVISSTDSAIKSYQEVIDNYPESEYADDAQFCIAVAYYIKARASSNENDAGKAIEAFQKVITNYPEAELGPYTTENLSFVIPETVSSPLAVAQWQIASIYRSIKKDYPQALIEYNKVIDNYPQNICAHPVGTYEIDRLLCPELNDYTPSIEAYQKLLKTRTNTPKDIAYFKKRIKEFKTKQAALKKQG